MNNNIHVSPKQFRASAGTVKCLWKQAFLNGVETFQLSFDVKVDISATTGNFYEKK